MSAIESHSQALKEVSRAIFVEVDKVFGEGAWSTAVFDMRMPPDEGCAMSMTRIRIGNQVKRMNLNSTMKHEFLLVSARDGLPGGPWFGLYVIVRSNGNVKVNYDYNPDCIDGLFDDSHFFDDE